MHFIINNKYIKKIKNFLSVQYESLNLKIDNVHIKCSNNEVILIIRNENYFFKLEIKKDEDLKIKKTGSFSLNIKLFNSLLEKLKPSNNLEIFKSEDNNIQFFSGDFECNLIFLEEKVNNPEKINLEEKDKISISYSILKLTYSKLKNFCKNQDSSQNTLLKCIHLRKLNNSEVLEVWSSDNYRTVFGQFKFKCDREFEINISPSIINTLLFLFLEYSEEDLEIWINDDDFFCKKDGLIMKVKIERGNFPELSHWFNTNNNKEFLVSKSDLLSAIERNLLLSNKVIQTTFYRLENEKLWIEYKDSEKGFCKEFIKIKKFTDGDIDFSLNNNLLKPLIKNIDSENIIFSISDSFKPIVLLSSNESEIFKQFILPIRNV
ncbi:DNA polymerase III beta subunit [Mycoplasma haemofelis Ohio2]|uniref:DNA polymerase III beta subunit n=1 Tax=Mycoplasma haemofelis (strain Ohio2) TaxID=859194 RepID=F6FJA5_MYCHI|nr:DNA polymerase III beta subunit [Mycoplasma haemofelis Ohio2]